MKTTTHASSNRRRRRFARLPLVSAIAVALGSVGAVRAAEAPGGADLAAAGSTIAAETSAASDLAATGSAIAAEANAVGQAPAEEERSTALETITVTAQKRTEDVQKVPISMTVLGAQELERNYISDFKDYAKLLPTVSFSTFGPGFSQVYMRGIANGSNGNHSGPLPSVGVYLDEEPITTITGELDLHIYDIERVEALAGPQGTLYGASSQSGTIRIITNKPDPGQFEAGYQLKGVTVDEGGSGGSAEGFVNVPIGESIAFRASVWDVYDPGYIDNVPGTRTYPTSGITETNASRVEDDYNDTRTRGLRAAVKFDFSDDWSLMPTVMHQSQEEDGTFAFDRTVGDLKLSHVYPEFSDDEWTQIAATLTGKIGRFDVVYSGAHLDRDVDVDSDYADYAFWYDTLYGYGAYFYGDDGNLVNPAQFIQGKDRYTKRSHEFRISSPSDDRFRIVAGLFWQQQSHDIQQRYKVNDLASTLEVTGWPDTIWLTKQVRQDHDEALFFDGSFDITDKWIVSAGVRFFKVDNSLKGFFGFGEGYSGSTGEAACFEGSGTFNGAPCVNLDKRVREDGHVEKFSVKYQMDEEKMFYGTYSEGFRPGGINRRGTLPPYLSDFLTNYEAGWKLLLMDRRLSFNGAVFHEQWKDFQFAILGANGLTEIKNANQAEVNGLEMQANWAATYNLTLSGGFAYYDAELTENYCGFTDEEGRPVTECDVPEAPDGTELPITARFKGNVTGRYEFDIGEYNAFVQGVVAGEEKRTSDLRLETRDILGDLPGYVLVDFSAGIAHGSWRLEAFVKNAFDQRAELTRFAQCDESVCGEQTYVVPTTPRTFGIVFSQKF